MSEFREVSTRELSFNVFHTIDKQWGVITTADEGKANAMTASWFQMGHMWRHDIISVYVRPQRHTFPLLNQNNTFSVCIFDETEENRKHLAYLGKASGKDSDKLADCKYTTEYYEETPYIAEAKLVFICEKIYQQDIKEDAFLDKEIAERDYGIKDFHRMYVGKINAVLLKD